jgi:hypothetical protein
LTKSIPRHNTIRRRRPGGRLHRGAFDPAAEPADAGFQRGTSAKAVIPRVGGQAEIMIFDEPTGIDVGAKAKSTI